MTTRKKGLWHRLKRALDIKPKCTDVETPIFGKRDPVEVDMADAGTSKKLKQETKTIVKATESITVANAGHHEGSGMELSRAWEPTCSKVPERASKR